jgi:hypothetical protein
MNKLALISTYCDSTEKLNTLKNSINNFKNLNVDTFIYSPLKLPEDIEKECKFLFYTDENPILELPIRGHHYWKTYKPKNTKFIRLSVIKPDYGWASNYQLKKLINFSASYDYDIFYLTIYDLYFDDNIKSIIKSNKVNLVNPGNIEGFTHTLHFTPFNKEMMIKAEKYFDYNFYINHPEYAAEHVAKQWVENLGMELQTTPVIDTQKVDNNIFNLSINKEYEFFTNNDGGDVKLIFTEIKDDIKLKINDYIIDSKLKIDYSIYNDSYTDEYIDVIKKQNKKYTIEEL